ncbi:Hypothetical protein NTJ_03157 [Nesidiocoris tenuis]|uniref:Uncharacterized protein n=1 Tax=Nesidiocoris tenuis TaxID=355587 RepID=A0ABN7ADI9_9HEMI|nr:Hypothetical protein NTJ_03157 [Nesidiocoris tenuis]
MRSDNINSLARSQIAGKFEDAREFIGEVVNAKGSRARDIDFARVSIFLPARGRVSGVSPASGSPRSIPPPPPRLRGSLVFSLRTAVT